MRHTVAISDIHLCEIEPTDGLWMRYRQAPYAPDRELCAMLDALRERVRGDELCLVLNGDVFDFDAPRVIDGESVFHDLPRTAEHALPALHAILDDHPDVVAALGRVIADGHQIVFVSGNHDVQLTLPEVRAALAARLAEAAGVPDARDHVLFRAWFHETPDGIVLEHGHQYDAYCSYRYPMAPFGPGAREIQPTMGSLCTRNLISRMGFFNPHVDNSFMLSAFGYLAHWARYYLFSRHSLAIAYARGAARTVAELVRRRFPGDRRRRRANVVDAAHETQSSLKAVARHARLFAAPAEDRLPLVLREFWVDRVALGTLALALGVVFLTLARGPLVAGAAIVPALFVTYELSIPKIALDETWRRVQRVARRVARAHRARAVVFGHTHKPEGVWEDGVFYGNTGSWSPAFADLECKRPIAEERPLIWLRTDGDRLEGGLVRWHAGAFSEPRA
jgi:UDP-2,3-diacylglucosamine pyrophosphatase LpxH